MSNGYKAYPIHSDDETVQFDLKKLFTVYLSYYELPSLSKTNVQCFKICEAEGEAYND